MTWFATKRAQLGGFWSLTAVLALACGNLTKSPGTGPDASDGGDPNVDTPTAGSATALGGTSQNAFGGTTNSAGSGTGGLVLVTGGSSTEPETPFHPDFGGQGAGGQPVYDDASLCIYDEDIPAEWGPEVVPDGLGGECTVGVLGPFYFKDCPYELLEVTPYDVDPFTGGHSHCCYKSRLLPCR